MTGAGVLPFVFFRQISDHSFGVANGLAAGLMLSASHALVTEGATQDVPFTVFGILLGLRAIPRANKYVDG